MNFVVLLIPFLAFHVFSTDGTKISGATSSLAKVIFKSKKKKQVLAQETMKEIVNEVGSDVGLARR